uniref:Uncharacterized protein n=1 Tax=Rhizophora mucronata TaxID=61149 RepID=A0A2P2PI56_RHIMU
MWLIYTNTVSCIAVHLHSMKKLANAKMGIVWHIEWGQSSMPLCNTAFC